MVRFHDDKWMRQSVFFCRSVKQGKFPDKTLFDQWWWMWPHAFGDTPLDLGHLFWNEVDLAPRPVQKSS
jgi:hypothetical protein